MGSGRREYGVSRRGDVGRCRPDNQIPCVQLFQKLRIRLPSRITVNILGFALTGSTIGGAQKPPHLYIRKTTVEGGTLPDTCTSRRCSMIRFVSGAFCLHPIACGATTAAVADGHWQAIVVTSIQNGLKSFVQNLGFRGNRRGFRLPRLVRRPTPKSGEVRHRIEQYMFQPAAAVELNNSFAYCANKLPTV
jgi:hypothetical protein